MAWSNYNDEEDDNSEGADDPRSSIVIAKTCLLCGHEVQCLEQQGGVHHLPGLPAGVKFDPTDNELLEHLEGKVRPDVHKLHPLIDEFIPTIDGEEGICYTHPEKLPGLRRDGLIRHFFHRPSKAYTTGNRKRRKVQTDEDGSETRWHKTGKTRPVFVGGKVKGYKKILVLYTNYGKQRKPEKTNWVMHQYHIGNNEEEKEGELVVSKVFYQTQPRQCSNNGNVKELPLQAEPKCPINLKETSNHVEFYDSSLMSSCPHGSHNKSSTTTSHVLSNFVVHNADESPFDLP